MYCFPCSSVGKESAGSAGDLGLMSGWEDPLEKEMATHSNIIAWKISWTEDPGELQSMGRKELGNTEGLTLTKFIKYALNNIMESNT